MGEKTNIAWTDATWNPWIGCSEVSSGCDHCYARTAMRRRGRAWELTRTGRATFYAPLRWKEPRRIFTCSWSDFFHPQVPTEWQQEAWDIMLATPQHTYQVLTKRPGRMAWWASQHGWPDHIWAGTSVESAKYLPRLDVLARVPAKVRFVSFEPLLGDLGDIRPYFYCCGCGQRPCICKGTFLSWVIVGAESGPNHRPMKTEWVADIARQCSAAGVPLFVKQDSGLYPGRQGRLPDSLWARKQFPKEAQ